MKKNVLIIFAILFVVFSISCKREEFSKVDDSSGLRLKTDNTAYIQGLIDNGGTTVAIPDGTYYINQDVKVKPKSGMTLDLSGVTFRANISTSTNLSALIWIEGKNNVTVTGGTLIGDRLLTTLGGNETAMGIFVSNSDYVTITGTNAQECKGDGFFVGYTSTNVTISSVTADHNRRQGLSIVSVDGCIVQNSVFKNTIGTLPEAGIDVEPDAGGSVTNVQILNNQLFGNAGSGILVCYPNGGTVSGVTLSGNTIYSNATNGISIGINGLTVSTNTVYSNTGHGISCSGRSNNIINNNKAYSNTIHGIVLSNSVTAGSANNTVTNNITYTNSHSGIDLYGTGTTGNSVTGNTSYGNIDNQIIDSNGGNTISGNITSGKLPIAKYLLNSSGTSTSAPDNSGNGHSGTITGAAFSWGTGGISGRSSYNNALRINSANEKTTYVSIPDDAVFDFGTGPFTVAFWVKKMVTTSSYTNYWGVTKWNTGAGTGLNEWAVQLSGSGGADVPTFVIEKSVSPYTNYSIAAGTTSIPINTWHHVAGVRNGVYLYIYVDGVLRGTSAAMPINTSVCNAGRMLYIGAAAAHSTGRPNAYFDNVRIYNQALTTENILELYNYTGNN